MESILEERREKKGERRKQQRHRDIERHSGGRSTRGDLFVLSRLGVGEGQNGTRGGRMTSLSPR